jgi:hypothetical protein
MSKSHPLSRERKRSAVALIKLLLAEKNPDILRVHRRELLRVLLYKLTEAESPKYETRFQSKAASERKGHVELRHDHVFRRAKMVDDLEKAMEKIDIILRNAIACTVTAEEDRNLSKVGKRYDGWARYKQAKIAVIDTRTGKQKA